MTNRQKALWKLQYMDFAIHETVLYLDGHPDNEKAMAYYKKALAERNEYAARFTDKFGPITSKDVTGDTWKWIDSPWPWEKEA